jgi:hypothetical protein
MGEDAQDWSNPAIDQQIPSERSGTDLTPHAQEMGNMVKKKEGGLTVEEQRLVKALLAEGWRNQDIQALVNHH